jgi:hypothetical protein
LKRCKCVMHCSWPVHLVAMSACFIPPSDTHIAAPCCCVAFLSLPSVTQPWASTGVQQTPQCVMQLGTPRATWQQCMATCWCSQNLSRYGSAGNAVRSWGNTGKQCSRKIGTLCRRHWKSLRIWSLGSL